MREQNTTLAYALGHIDAAYIADAELPELTAAASCPGRTRRERHISRFWESGWFAAAFSGIVAVGILTFIVMAGRRTPRPPAGTDASIPPVTETAPAEDETASGETVSPHTVPDGFTVTDAAYDFRGDTVILLHISSDEIQENVILTVQLYSTDEAGNATLEGRQRVRGFPAGYEKYLMFRISKEIPSYSYTITTKPYDGECLDPLYRSEFYRIYEDVSYVPPDENGEPCYDPEYWYVDETYPCLNLQMTHAYLGTDPVEVTHTTIIFDNKGEIFHITETISNYYSHYQSSGYQHMPFYVTAEETVTWPEELLGDNVTAIRVYSVADTNRIFPDLP